MNNYKSDIKLKNINNRTNDFLKKMKKYSDSEIINYINKATSDNFNLLMTFTNNEESFFLKEKYVQLMIRLIKEKKNGIIDAFIKNGLNPYESFMDDKNERLDKSGFYYRYIKTIKIKNQDYSIFEEFLIKCIKENIKQENIDSLANLLDENSKKDNPEINIKTKKEFLEIPLIKENALYHKSFITHRNIEEIGFLLRKQKENKILFTQHKEIFYSNIYSYLSSHVFFYNTDMKKELLKIVNSIEEFNNEILSPNCHNINTYYDFYFSLLKEKSLLNEIKIDVNKNNIKSPLYSLLLNISKNENLNELYQQLNIAGFKPSNEEIKKILFFNDKYSFDMTNVFFANEEKDSIKYNVLDDLIKVDFKLDEDRSIIPFEYVDFNYIFEKINYNFTENQYIEILKNLIAAVEENKNKSHLLKMQYDSLLKNIIIKIPEKILLNIISENAIGLKLLNSMIDKVKISKEFINELFNISNDYNQKYSNIIILSKSDLILYSSNDIKLENVSNFFNFELYKNKTFENADNMFNKMELFVKIISKENYIKLEDQVKKEFINYVISSSLNMDKIFLELCNTYKPELSSQVEKIIVQKEIENSNSNSNLIIKNKKRL